MDRLKSISLKGLGLVSQNFSGFCKHVCKSNLVQTVQFCVFLWHHGTPASCTQCLHLLCPKHHHTPSPIDARERLQLVPHEGLSRSPVSPEVLQLKHMFILTLLHHIMGRFLVHSTFFFYTSIDFTPIKLLIFTYFIKSGLCKEEEYHAVMHCLKNEVYIWEAQMQKPVSASIVKNYNFIYIFILNVFFLRTVIVERTESEAGWSDQKWSLYWPNSV